MHLALLMLLLAQQTAMLPLPSDQTISAELKKTVASNHAHSGDRVELVVLEDWRGKNGEVRIPAKARLTGTVVFVKKHRGTESGALSILVTEAKWKDGSSTLHATIEKLVIMGVWRTAGNVALSDGSNPGLGDIVKQEDTLEPVPKDCSVESVKESPVHTAVVCRKRNVVLGEGAQFLLLENANSADRGQDQQ
ncbi:MAG TPA: hypothetical protein VGS27_25915 [Candidatus Sulfotelmatobacter sp.]|nr:hypothetical protein [Candidatus Sulfotelmatobacter sp.]